MTSLYVLQGLSVAGACSAFVVTLMCVIVIAVEWAREQRREVLIWFLILMLVSIFVIGAFIGFSNAIDQALR